MFEVVTHGQDVELAVRSVQDQQVGCLPVWGASRWLDVAGVDLVDGDSRLQVARRSRRSGGRQRASCRSSGLGNIAFWGSLAQWGPAAVTNALAVGGSRQGLTGGAPRLIGYGTAALLAIGYGPLSLAICSTALARRDVTS